MGKWITEIGVQFLDDDGDVIADLSNQVRGITFDLRPGVTSGSGTMLLPAMDLPSSIFNLRITSYFEEDGANIYSIGFGGISIGPPGGGTNSAGASSNTRTIYLPGNAVIDSNYSDAPPSIVVTFRDRRWRWDFGALDGWYNNRGANFPYVVKPDAIRGRFEPNQVDRIDKILLTEMLIALGESPGVTANIRNVREQTTRVDAKWIGASAVDAMAEFVERIGGIVVLRPDGIIDILKDDVEQYVDPTLRWATYPPEDEDVIKDSATFERTPPPEFIRVVTNQVRYDCAFKLVPVIPDQQGNIDELLVSPIRPAAPSDWGDFSQLPGWPAIPDPNDQLLAVKYAYRLYRIDFVNGAGTGPLPPGTPFPPFGGQAPTITPVGYTNGHFGWEYPSRSIEKVLPILQVRNNPISTVQTGPNQSEKRITNTNIPDTLSGTVQNPEVWGRFWDPLNGAGNRTGKYEGDPAVHSFKIYGDLGLVLFKNPVYVKHVRNAGGDDEETIIIEPEISLHAACIADEATGVNIKRYYYYEIPTNLPGGKGVHVIRDLTLYPQVTARYNPIFLPIGHHDIIGGGPPFVSGVSYATNFDAINEIADRQAKAELRKYQREQSYRLAYRGIRNFSPDALKDSVRWDFGEGSIPTTTVSVGMPTFDDSPDYRDIEEQLRARQREALAAKAEASKMAGLIRYDSERP